MKHKNLIDRELRIMLEDGLRHVLKMCRKYEELSDGAYVAVVRNCMRYYAVKVKRNRWMKLAAFVGGVSLDDLVNEEFERVYGEHLRDFSAPKT